MFQKLKLWGYEVKYTTDILKAEFEIVYMRFLEALYDCNNKYFPGVRFYNTVIDRKDKMIAAYINKATNLNCEISIRLKNIKGKEKNLLLAFVYSIPYYGLKSTLDGNNLLRQEVIKKISTYKEQYKLKENISDENHVSFNIDDKYGQGSRWIYFEELTYKNFEIIPIMENLSYLYRIGTNISEEYIERKYFIEQNF